MAEFKDNFNMIRRPTDIERMVNDLGFLPFCANDISQFSIEENTPGDLWFVDDTDGPWEWKGPVIVDGDCAYGKFYRNKTMYVSMEWFPDFMNWRRSQYKLTAQEKKVLTVLKEHHSLLSKQLKRESGYLPKNRHRPNNPVLQLSEDETRSDMELRRASTAKNKKKKESFETCITHLQMSTHVVTADFEYNYDKQGKRYGWGVARYCTPEDFFGAERLIVDRTPEESVRKIFNHLRKRLPWATEEQIWKIIM
ncbi:MAG: AlkZ-related protein [Prevotella sp.]|jgi:hypothetical protein